VFALLKPAILLVVLLTAIAFESTLPATINNDVVPHLDKVVHFFVFGMVAWLLAGAISAHYKSLKSDFLVVCISIVLVALLGVGDEWIQSFTPSRHAELNDVLADIAGGVVFLLVYLRCNNPIYFKKETCNSQEVSDA